MSTAEGDLEALHAALLLGRFIQLPEGTLLVCDGRFRYRVKADRYGRTILDAQDGLYVGVQPCLPGHKDYTVWMKVSSVDRLLELPEGCDVAALLNDA